MLNEHDIEDYKQENEEYQPVGEKKDLYKLSRKSFFTIDDFPWVIFFHHVDGAYSYCTIANGPNQGEAVHLAAWAPVQEVIKVIKVQEDKSNSG
jgi:hypothetical protein